MSQDKTEVRFIRLVTGEDIIAEMKPLVVDNRVVIVNPLKIVYAFGEKSGTITIGLVQWIFAEVANIDSIPIKQSDILVISEPTNEMKHSYWQSLKKLENSFSFEFINKSKSKEEDMQEDLLENLTSDMEISNEDVDALQEILESLRIDKRKLH